MESGNPGEAITAEDLIYIGSNKQSGKESGSHRSGDAITPKY